MEQGKGQRLSPEAQTYKTWLNVSRQESGKLPPPEKRKRVKETLRSVRSKGEDADRQERERKEKGEARLRELYERKEITPALIGYLAAHWDLEPWETLERLENGALWNMILTVEARENNALKAAMEKIANNVQIKDYEEMKIDEESVEMSISLLNRHAFAHKITFLLTEETPPEHLRRMFDALTHERYGRERFILKKDALQERITDGDRGELIEERRDYWIMLQAILEADVRAYGYTSKKEVRAMIAHRREQVERHLGFSLDHPIKFISTGADLDRFTTQDIRDVQEIVARERRAREVPKERERDFKDRMRAMFVELDNLSKKKKGVSTAIALSNSWTAKIARIFAGNKDENSRAQLHEINNRLLQLADQLSTLNDTIGITGHYMYRGRFDTRGVDKSSDDDYIAFWLKIAEEELVKMVDEYSAK